MLKTMFAVFVAYIIGLFIWGAMRLVFDSAVFVNTYLLLFLFLSFAGYLALSVRAKTLLKKDTQMIIGLGFIVFTSMGIIKFFTASLTGVPELEEIIGLMDVMPNIFSTLLAIFYLVNTITPLRALGLLKTQAVTPS